MSILTNLSVYPVSDTLTQGSVSAAGADGSEA